MRATVVIQLLAVAIVGSCNTKRETPAAAHSTLADSADLILYPVRFNITDLGALRARVEADIGYFFDDNTRTELDRVRTTFYDVNGAKDAVLTSRRGTYNSRTGIMLAQTDVVVLSEDGRRLSTPELIYSNQRNEISSDSAFVLTEPNRQLEGIGFRSDPNMNNIRILKRAGGIVNGITSPAPTEDTARAEPLTVRPSQ